MTNVFTLANLKALAIMVALAAVVAAVAPNVQIKVENKTAAACPAGDPDCDG